MKRLWFAIIFLFICLGMCLAEQYYIGRFYDEMNKRLDTAAAYSQSGDMRLKEAVEDIKSYWNKNNDLIFALANHGELDDLSADIRSLDAADELDDFRDIKARLKIFYENQRVSPANIF